MELFAREPSTVGRASLVNDSNSSTAVDRWRRLKTLYPTQESLVIANDRPANAAPTSRAGDVIRPIPDEPTEDKPQPAAESKPAVVSEPSHRPAPDEPEISSSITRPKPAPLIALVDEEPAWVLTESKSESEVGEAPAAEVDDGGVHALEPSHFVPAPIEDAVTPQRQAALQESASSARPSTRQVSHAQISPVKYRNISLISPFLERTDDGRDIDHDIRAFAKEQSQELNVVFPTGPFPERAFPQVVKPWEAPNFFYYPLYFEDPALERYGHTHHPLVQPFVSIGRFSTQLVFLPYQMTIDPPCREVYSLGWYRPGECAPKLHYQVPLNAKAAAVEAATVTGLVFLIP